MKIPRIRQGKPEKAGYFWFGFPGLREYYTGLHTQKSELWLFHWIIAGVLLQVNMSEVESPGGLRKQDTLKRKHRGHGV